MSGIRISPSPDLARLEADGFRLRVIQGTAHHLLIEGIPAVTPKREVVLGTLYCPLDLDQHGKTVNPCSNHQCWWIGEPPCDSSGRIMTEMISNPSVEDKGDGLKTTVGFSRKRANKTPYDDFHEKIWAYVQLIWHEGASPRSELRSTAQQASAGSGRGAGAGISLSRHGNDPGRHRCGNSEALGIPSCHYWSRRNRFLHSRPARQDADRRTSSV